MDNTIYDAGFHTPYDDRITKEQLNWFMNTFDVFPTRFPAEVPGLIRHDCKIPRWSEKAMNILYPPKGVPRREAPRSSLPPPRPELRLASDVANELDRVFSIRNTDSLDKCPSDIVEGATEAIKKRVYEEGYKAGYADGELDGYYEGSNDTQL